MNKSFFLFIFIAVFLGSCCNSSEKDKDQSNTTVTETNADIESHNASTEPDREDNAELPSKDGENASEELDFKLEDCDEFLDEYEAWANDYIDLLERFKKNPASPNVARDYNKLSKEYTNWTSEWFEFVQCTEVDDYQKRYNDINNKIELKQAELQGD